ncbi:hypothetical protein IW150_003464 [Coemansia sp. RSA 2607]|nr:hypothetical protein IW150_003464 [Coemansia sp. RSA 2607]
MRVFVIPITRTQWALHCHPANSVPTRMTRWAAVAYEKWSKWSTYPRNSWRGKIYAYGETLMDKIDFREYFLKEIPTKSEGALVSKVDIIAPSLVTQSEILHELRVLAATQDPYHRKWMKYCCYLLPISSLFTLVPVVPNFPFFYNLFRVYSHYKASHGARHLLHFLDSGAYEVVHDSELSRWYSGGAIPGPSSTPDSRTVAGSGDSYNEARTPNSCSDRGNDDFDHQTLESTSRLLEDDPPLITDNDIARMASHFMLPAFESAIRRARHQIISEKTKPVQH